MNRFRRVGVSFAVFLLCAITSSIRAQVPPGRGDIPNSAAIAGGAGANDVVPIGSGMLAPFLPKIPNLEFGFLYSFGRNVSAGRFTADYLLPINLNADSAVFGEVHAEGQDFWKSRSNATVAGGPGTLVTTSSANTRVDLSLGGGYRTMLGSSALAGVNGFYDTTRLFDQWYSSGGLGLEFAANVGDYDAVDVNLNWNGALFSRDGFVNAFRNNGYSFDLEAGYSHAVLDETMDLRLKVTGYQFHAGRPVRGWRGGADLTTRDGMFTLRYEHGVDPVNGDYNTVGGFVTLGFSLENVLSGESPFTMPEPVFRSPRNLRRLLGLKVKRNWSQPTAVVVARSYQAPAPPTPTPTAVVVARASQATATEPAPPACPNLQGSILYTTLFAGSFPGSTPYQTSPAIPSLPIGKVVRVCWCGLQNYPIATTFTLYDGVGNQLGNKNTHPLDGETGCADIPMPHNPSAEPNNGAKVQDTLFLSLQEAGFLSRCRELFYRWKLRSRHAPHGSQPNYVLRGRRQAISPFERGLTLRLSRYCTVSGVLMTSRVRRSVNR